MSLLLIVLHYGAVLHNRELSAVGDNVLDTLGNMVNILGGNSADGDATILSHINAVLLDHSLRLLDSQTGEGEHANLGGDVGPVSLDTLLLNCGAEGLAHIVHTFADDDELIEPLLTKSHIVQDCGCDSGTVLRGARVVATNDDFDLGEDTSGLSFVSADEVKGTGTLSVKTHNLGEGLSDNHLEALGKEKAETVGILIKVTRGETLISGIKEGV